MTTRTILSAPSFPRGFGDKAFALPTGAALVADEPPGLGVADAPPARSARFIHVHRDGSSEVVIISTADLARFANDGTMMPTGWCDADGRKPSNGKG